MVVKKNILFLLFFFGNLQIIFSLFFKKATLGQVWYFINSNSLVGFQNLIETNVSNLYHIFYALLNYNFFFILGLILIVIVVFITDLLA